MVKDHGCLLRMKRTITEISAQKRNRRRVNICLNGSYAFSLDRLTAAWLQVGRELSDEEIEKLQSRDEVEVGFNQALNLLSYRNRSSVEMTRYLEGKGDKTHPEAYPNSFLKLLDNGYRPVPAVAEISGERCFKPC